MRRDQVRRTRIWQVVFGSGTPTATVNVGARTLKQAIRKAKHAYEDERSEGDGVGEAYEVVSVTLLAEAVV